MNFLKSEIIFFETLNAGVFPDDALLIVDKTVQKLLGPAFLKSFKYVYAVDAGEKLKELSEFPHHIQNILEIWDTTVSRNHAIVAVGGGSIGDFAGFVASVLKRGVRLIHVPSTWLSAIDSAHGGKTALNVGQYKNQVGTFYPAEQIFIFKELLDMQPQERAVEGLGELVKMALLVEPSFVPKLLESSSAAPDVVVWNNLRLAIEAKYQIVELDPRETRGLRQLLNLGHTMGHVFEGYLKKSHGESIIQGLFFAMEWSFHKGYLSREDYDSIRAAFEKLHLTSWLLLKSFVPLPAKQVRKILLRDKKAQAGEQVDFIFLKKPGQALLEKVPVDEVVREAVRQGWSLE